MGSGIKFWLSFLLKHMIQTGEKIMSDRGSDCRFGVPSTALNIPMKDVLRKICAIDLHHEVEILNLENSDIDSNSKEVLKKTLRAECEDERRPYVDFLNALWRQYNRHPFAA
jgi:hypothetical protein